MLSMDMRIHTASASLMYQLCTLCCSAARASKLLVTVSNCAYYVSVPERPRDAKHTTFTTNRLNKGELLLTAKVTACLKRAYEERHVFRRDVPDVGSLTSWGRIWGLLTALARPAPVSQLVDRYRIVLSSRIFGCARDAIFDLN